jgi:type IV secretory pathway TrbD component
MRALLGTAASVLVFTVASVSGGGGLALWLLGAAAALGLVALIGHRLTA